MIEQAGSLPKITGDLSNFVNSWGFLDWASVNAPPAPDELPDSVRAAFEEGARCLAVRCPNAASAMFRLCLDLATKELLPKETEGEGPSKQERRNLAPRLRWLFHHGRLPAELEGLSQAVKDNGDDGVHEGALTEEDAQDIHEFAFMLLERIYTLPARLEASKLRRLERKSKADTAG
ncbi:DUF4145 domain-containing protein [Sphingobium sp. B11D3D]|uniref:DUF4145 domain-containing protein n=1 Tax=Sphingobium sp. B11D3D TaxID=2940576 RepID=UPI0039B55B23